eukprot:m.5578 g.5578  ORF g.5578 m.5578 type:complete len:186 (+) comp3334_c0_seq1:2595-3152(+)
MPAIHSKHNKMDPKPKVLGGVAILPFAAKHSKGPAPIPGPNVEVDIIDEAITYFKANIFFQTYEIKGDADKLLLYLTLFVHQCLLRMTRCSSKDAVLKEMYQLSIETFKLPMDAGFPLSSFYSPISSKRDSDELRAYLLQCRQEVSSRLAEIVIDKTTGKPSKWWMCFTKRKFLGKSLESAGSHR